MPPIRLYPVEFGTPISIEMFRSCDAECVRICQAVRVFRMYEWIKALHVIAVISWMAGMLYLPRLFVYHCEAEIGSKQSETFKVMERRLLKAIINPAMILTWVFGLYLAWAGHWFSAPWLHGKLLLVIAMSGIHGFFARCVRDFGADQNLRSQKFYRIINEVPTLLMIGIVILVVVKPF
jgi:protoporphyrinogen IX oxidase